MSRICTIKAELFTHEKLFELEKKVALPLRLAFIGLLACCNEVGHFRWKPRELKLDVLPYDEVNFDDILRALLLGGFIDKFDSCERTYGYFTSWRRHNSVVLWGQDT